MNDALSALLAVQKIDSKIRTYQGRIDRLNAQRAKIEKTIAEEEESLNKKQAAFDELRKAGQERSAEADDLDSQIREYEERLEGGLLSFKEMESFRTQIATSKQKMEAAEEEAIELLNKTEEEAEKMKKQEASFNQWKSRIEEELHEIEEDLTLNQQKLEAEREKRESMLKNVDPVYLEKYNLLLKIVEDPIAPIRDGMCNGCHVILSTTTLEKARMAEGIVTCENCNRLIYI